MGVGSETLSAFFFLAKSPYIKLYFTKLSVFSVQCSKEIYGGKKNKLRNFWNFGTFSTIHAVERVKRTSKSSAGHGIFTGTSGTLEFLSTLAVPFPLWLDIMCRVLRFVSKGDWNEKAKCRP